RWVEFEPAPEIFQARFAMDQRSFHSGKRTPSGDRELVVLDRDIEPILVDSRHLNFQRVAVPGFNHACWWRNELLALRPIAVPVFTSYSIHGETSFWCELN